MTKKIDNDQKIYLKYIIFLQQQTLMLSLTEPWQQQTLILNKYFGHIHHVNVHHCEFFGHVHKFWSYSFSHLELVKWTFLIILIYFRILHLSRVSGVIKGRLPLVAYFKVWMPDKSMNIMKFYATHLEGH